MPLAVLAALLVASLWTPLSFAEDRGVELIGIERGKSYKLTVAPDGTLTLVPLERLTVGGSPSPPPTSPPTNPPPAPTAFSAKITEFTRAVLANGGSKTTGAALSSAYSIVADEVASGAIAPGEEFNAIKRANDAILNVQPDGAKWAQYRTDVGNALTTLRDQGLLQTKEQVAGVLKEIAAGMNRATGFSLEPQSLVAKQATELDRMGAILDGIDLAKLIELIKLVMELIRLFRG